MNQKPGTMKYGIITVILPLRDFDESKMASIIGNFYLTANQYGFDAHLILARRVKAKVTVEVDGEDIVIHTFDAQTVYLQFVTQSQNVGNAEVALKNACLKMADVKEGINGYKLGYKIQTKYSNQIPFANPRRSEEPEEEDFRTPY